MNMSFHTDPPESFHGLVENTEHAILLANAAHQGKIPRTTRRLNETERSSDVLSGCIFIFSVQESGVQRWTDHLFWSPSSIMGNFLVYREMTERCRVRKTRRNTHSSTVAGAVTPLVGGVRPTHGRSASPERQMSISPVFGNPTPSIKASGLRKKTITINVNSINLHLVAYFKACDINAGQHLQPPTSSTEIMNTPIPVQAFNLDNLRHPPKIVAVPPGQEIFVYEPEHTDTTTESLMISPSPQATPPPPWNSESDLSPASESSSSSSWIMPNCYDPAPVFPPWSPASSSHRVYMMDMEEPRDRDHDDDGPPPPFPRIAESSLRHALSYSHLGDCQDYARGNSERPGAQVYVEPEG